MERGKAKMVRSLPRRIRSFNGAARVQGLQWGRVHGTRKRTYHSKCPDVRIWLQWGRVHGTRKSRCEPSESGPAQCGFNGAAFMERGKAGLDGLLAGFHPPLQWGRVHGTRKRAIRLPRSTAFEPASMGPRSWNAEKGVPPEKNPFVLRCFNGAAFMERGKVRGGRARRRT